MIHRVFLSSAKLPVPSPEVAAWAVAVRAGQKVVLSELAMVRRSSSGSAGTANAVPQRLEIQIQRF